MKHSKLSFKLGISVLAFGLSGLAGADCYIGAETNASSVQADSGNGTYSCSVLSTTNGTMHDVTSQLTYSVGTDGRVTWSVPVNANGYPTVDVDMVSVARSSGKRCNYNYSSQQKNGTGLSTSDGGAVIYVTACADGVIAPEPPPPPPQPISTVGNGCDATFSYNSNSNGKFDVAIGYSKDAGNGLEGAAVCANTAGLGGSQHQCINECVPHVIPAGTDCTANANGEVPVECRACEFEDAASISKGLKYCYYWENHVDTATAGYFKPGPKKKSLSAQIDVTTGSNCYTVTVGPMYGGATYSYQYCP